MKIKGKLIISYLVIGVMLIGIGILSLVSLSEMNDNGRQMYDDRVLPLVYLSDVSRLSENTRVQMLSTVYTEDPELTSNAENNLIEINGLLVSYNATKLTPEEEMLVRQFENDWNLYSETVTQDIENIRSGDFEEAQQRIEISAALFRDARESLIQLVNLNEAIAADLNARNNSVFATNRVIITITMVAAFIVAITIGLVMGRSIGNPLKRVALRMEKVAEGDLTSEPLSSKSKDEISMLVAATNKMQEDLKKIVGKIALATQNVSAQSEELTQSAGEVREGSVQIAVTMQELASGSEAQATNAGTLSETMDVFAKKIKETNHQSQEISLRSREVMTNAESGSGMMESSVQQMMVIDQVMTDAVSKVRGLDHQTTEITKLVSVISEIAAQTNLLALNAAIEAARAGDHGKGFAVVADEVRKLAEQVAKSVNDITGFVNAIQSESRLVVGSLEQGYEEVNKGTRQMAVTGEKFNEINGSIQGMRTMIELISDNLEDISHGSQTMNESIQEIASISQESAAGVEETAASSEQSLSTMETISASADELAGLAEELAGEVRKFKLNT